MIEFVDIFFNQYSRIFVEIVLVGIILFSLYNNLMKKVTECRFENGLIFI